LQFTAPLTPGPYNFRLFASGGLTRIATSATVTVQPVPTLTIDDVNVMEGNSGTTTATFIVTLAPTSPDPVTVSYATVSGTASATLHFAGPLTPGTYNFRFFAGGLNRVAISATITVLPPPPPALGVSATTVTAGDGITVTVTNGPANLGDWVALYPAAAA